MGERHLTGLMSGIGAQLRDRAAISEAITAERFERRLARLASPEAVKSRKWTREAYARQREERIAATLKRGSYVSLDNARSFVAQCAAHPHVRKFAKAVADQCREGGWSARRGAILGKLIKIAKEAESGVAS